MVLSAKLQKELLFETTSVILLQWRRFLFGRERQGFALQDCQEDKGALSKSGAKAENAFSWRVSALLSTANLSFVTSLFFGPTEVGALPV
jgi:hypothetical protein